VRFININDSYTVRFIKIQCLQRHVFTACFSYLSISFASFSGRLCLLSIKVEFLHAPRAEKNTHSQREKQNCDSRSAEYITTHMSMTDRLITTMENNMDRLKKVSKVK